ncbi:MAG: hypothetical protein HYV03_08815 [Deltaproteobacteria bacterium]|nr:hypothetical protein [Deltaproteobacteria bacterium]
MRRVVHVMAIALLFAAAPVGLPSVTADRIDGRSLSVPLQFSPISLDPANLIDTDGVWIATQLFEGLFTYAADGAIRENLAAKWWVT